MSHICRGLADRPRPPYLSRRTKSESQRAWKSVAAQRNFPSLRERGTLAKRWRLVWEEKVKKKTAMKHKPPLRHFRRWEIFHFLAKKLHWFYEGYQREGLLFSQVVFVNCKVSCRVVKVASRKVENDEAFFLLPHSAFFKPYTCSVRKMLVGLTSITIQHSREKNGCWSRNRAAALIQIYVAV